MESVMWKDPGKFSEQFSNLFLLASLKLLKNFISRDMFLCLDLGEHYWWQYSINLLEHLKVNMLAVVILVLVLHIPWTFGQQGISFFFTNNWCGTKWFCKQMKYCGKGWWLENCWSNFNFGRGECEGVRCGLYPPPHIRKKNISFISFLG